jgi:hypothetical protein
MTEARGHPSPAGDRYRLPRADLILRAGEPGQPDGPFRIDLSAPAAVSLELA